MKPHRSDSYQPSDSGVHSNRWIRGADGSIVRGSVGGGVEEERRVSVVCRGREGSQDSIYNQVSVIDRQSNGHGSYDIPMVPMAQTLGWEMLC